MSLKMRNIRGTRDVFGYDYQILKFVQDLAYNISRSYCFIPIDTPIMEYYEVFKKSLDETSDIINKEIYLFDDKSGDSIALRPEFTAAIARAFVQNLHHYPLPLRLFSVGALFRYERPQKGRLRQFNQFNFEVIGTESCSYDVELVQIASDILKKLNLNTEVILEINSLGDNESKNNYKKALEEYLTDYYEQLSPDSQRRLYKNTLRIFDSKDDNDQSILDGAPKICSYYNQNSEKFFNSFKAGLENIGINYKINHKLVRGLDYYSHTVFEFKISDNRSQNTVIGGGRYDGLIDAMGGKKMSCVGFAGGLERLIDISTINLDNELIISLVPIGKEAESIALNLSLNLRRNNFCVDYVYDVTLKKRMERASTKNIALIFGDEEINSKKIKIKYIDTKQEEIIDENFLISHLTLCKKKFNSSTGSL